MSEPFLADIKIFGFNFPPRNYAQCDGAILPINQNQSLFSLLGTTFGVDVFDAETVCVCCCEGEVRTSGPGGTGLREVVPAGATLFTAGSVVGLIEVMKTFTHLHYEAGAGLPERARVVKILVTDGAEVSATDALIELEEARR